jgi:O-antigen ligase
VAENYRALVALMVLSLPTLWMLRRSMTAVAIPVADFNRRATAWVLLSAILFLAENFWLFAAAALLVLLATRARDRNVLGAYFFLLFAAPPFQATIQGFAGINYFIAVDYLRILSFTMLLPTAVGILGRQGHAGLFKLPTDKYVAGYVVLLLALQAPLTSFTDLLRSALMHMVDVVLPYYVFSRSATTIKVIRDAAAAFVAASVLLSVVAVFESLKHWLLYSSLPNFMSLTWGYGHYLGREGSLRATVSLGHPIVLGYALSVALGLHLMLRPVLMPRAWKIILWVLIAGLIAPLSRGPWVGAMAVVVIGLAVGPGGAARVGKLGLTLLLVGGVLAVTPYFALIASYLPFVGDVDAATVTYRQQLFETALDVMLQNPLFGTPYFMSYAAMEQLRQGEGIIDVVNSYLAVGLVSGFIGLCLFCGAFLSALVGLGRQVFGRGAENTGNLVVARALLATLVGVLIIIATASSINAVPVVYWSLLGLCAGYLRATVAASEAEPSGSIVTSHPLRARSL